MIESAIIDATSSSSSTDAERADTIQPEAESSQPTTIHVSIDHILQRLNIRHNVVLITEVLLCLLVLYTTDTFSYYGNIVDYTKYRCTTNDTGKQCLEPSRTKFCEFLQSEPNFAFDWTHGSRSSFSTEFGMFCDREDESQAVMDIAGIGAGLGAAVGGILGDVFGRMLSLRISLLIYFVSLATLSFTHNIQILTLGLFLLGFSLYMNLTSIIVLITELLPFHMQYAFIIITATLNCAGIYLGCGLRMTMKRSWRALVWSLLALNTVLVALVVHLPLSPRYWIFRGPEHAKTTLHKLNIALFEDEELQVPDEFASQPKHDYKTNKPFLLRALVMLYLRAVVAMSNTPSAGKVWDLVEDSNIQYVVMTSLEFVAIPITCCLYFKNISLRSSILIFGWISASLCFIGELPVGSGIFILNNVVGVLLTPANRALHVFVVLTTLQITPTCYRASIFGLSLFVEKCCLKLGSLITGIDDLPNVRLTDNPAQVTYIHEYSFLVFGVIFLSFIYVASFLPTTTFRVLPSTVADFNAMFGPKSSSEQAYLLRNLPHTLDSDTEERAK